MATAIFFDRILEDRAAEGLRLAIKATRAHVVYFESFGIGLRTVITNLCDEYEKKCPLEPETSFMEEIQRQEAEVAEAQNDNSSARKKRLENHGGDVQARTVTHTVFNRNADVVAETLHRAKGNCEFCGLKAPFRKMVDGRPYLEVHHKQPLAENGKDLLCNTMALCPNCHREAHSGAERQKFRS